MYSKNIGVGEDCIRLTETKETKQSNAMYHQPLLDSVLKKSYTKSSWGSLWLD